MINLYYQIKKSTFFPWILCLISALFFWIAWPVKPFAPLLFFVFVPILVLEDYYAPKSQKKAGWKFFGFLYLTLILWNISTTWWVYYSTPAGTIAMIILNALLMTIPILLYRFSKKILGIRWGSFALIMYWISFEYLHLNWDLSWPWLTLGNGFSLYPRWIQWYEYTGVLGGSLWILWLNIMIFSWLKRKNSFNWRKWSIITAIITAPVLISYYLYFNYEEQGTEQEVVILQPNIDPFTEKFIGTTNFIPFDKQLDIFIQLSEQKITNNTRFLVWPETALDNQYYEENILNYPVIKKLLHFKKKHPQLSLIAGLTTLKQYQNKEEASPTARYHEQAGYYDVYNTALFIDNQNNISLYHKSKLVPGPEIMPYPQVFNFLTSLMFDLGGTSGSLGRQKERTVFYNKDSIGIAPSICYESIYGEFMSKYIKNGAQAIFIITNDGWWRNTAGHKQHLVYARLRAIETRKSIARSANTGISAFINQRGDIIEPTTFWTKDVIKSTIQTNNTLTFYTQYGNHIARLAVWLATFIFLATLVKRKIFKLE